MHEHNDLLRGVREHQRQRAAIVYIGYCVVVITLTLMIAVATISPA